jgi:hypothetical protein
MVVALSLMEFLVTPDTIVYSTSLYNIPTVRQRWVDQMPSTFALHLAASAGLTNAVIRLLEAGCDVDERDGTDSNVLYYACFNGDMDIVQILSRFRVLLPVVTHLPVEY